MSWVRVDDKIAFHRKVVAAGNEAFGAWMRMTAWSADQLSDGIIPSAIAWVIVGHGRDEVLDRLVEVGLLERCPEGFCVHDYHHHNPLAADVKAKRAADAERKASGRNAQGRTPDGRVSSSQVPSNVRVESERTNNGVQETSTGPHPHPHPHPPPQEEKETEPASRFDFEAVYNAYPGRGTKAKGIEHLRRLVKNQATYDRVLAATKRYAEEERAFKASGSKEFRPGVPNFSTWCNQRRWEDFDDGPQSQGLFAASPALSPAQQLAEEARRRREAEFEGQP